MLPFLNKPKDLDPSYKMDLDIWNSFGMKKTLFYSQRNMVGATQPKITTILRRGTALVFAHLKKGCSLNGKKPILTSSQLVLQYEMQHQKNQLTSR